MLNIFFINNFEITSFLLGCLTSPEKVAYTVCKIVDEEVLLKWKKKHFILLPQFIIQVQIYILVML
jgi:hypothetical protein